jgi:hypothetical protein
MVQELLAQLFDIVNGNEDIKLEEMPEYRLYISQLEEFFDKKLGKGTGDEEERKAISKTMIQNYIKDGMLMPPEGKCYNRSHVILLILIYTLKSILSIKDIKRLLSPILTDINKEDSSSEIELIYETYLSLKEDALDDLNDTLKERVYKVMEQPGLEGKSSEEMEKLRLLLLISTLVSEANIRKKIVETLIEKYFTLEE